ncbi:GPX3 [Symbiodinium sp. CCMP2456]|nr:GPX3 [Symbiodinium sp. CCMP2456]
MVVAVPSGGPGGPCPAGCEVRAAAPPKGFGLFACSSCSAYTDMFTEEPLFAMQHSGNRRVVAACARCCGFVPSVPLQLEVLFGESRFAPLLTALGDLPSRWQESCGEGQAAVVRCKQGCGELYCSEACRDMHFQHSHNLLCVGPLTTEDHPLLRFKYHALEHADTLLLAAQVFAFLINRAKAAGGGAEVMQGLMQELLCFCHAPFREACRPPPGRSKDTEFYAHADGLVSEAAALLRAALEPHAPNEVGALFATGPNFFAEVLGLFEYNNIDLEVQSPMGPLLQNRAKALAPHISNPQALAELKQLEALLREKEWVMRCIWGEETTGIFGDEADVANVGDAEPMDSLMKAAERGNDAEVASAAMAQATAEVAALSLEQLLQGVWPQMHGTALFASVARMNHSCAPNMKVAFPGNSARLTATSVLNISPGDELCICYVNQEADVQTRRRRLLEYGFTCTCSRCLAEDSATLRKAQKRLKRSPGVARELMGGGSSKEVAGDSIYDFQVKNIDGQEVSLQEYSGKVVLIVNLASKCLTKTNYAELSWAEQTCAGLFLLSLYRTVAGFEARFAEDHVPAGGQRHVTVMSDLQHIISQEPGTNAEVKAFAQSKCPDTFPLFAKIDAPLYTFLKARQGELLGSDIKWNFAKFLVDRQGQPVARFGPQQAESCSFS